MEGDLIGECPVGHYCPEGTGDDWVPCPTGTYMDDTGKWIFYYQADSWFFNPFGTIDTPVCGWRCL